MVESRLHQIVRQFAENGMRLLLENPLNVRDLLGLSVPDIVQMIDWRCGCGTKASRSGSTNGT